MNLNSLLPILEEMAPLAYAEDFDNVGLLVGERNMEITGILACHDALETVIDEAVSKDCNVVVCFHPILFSGLKSITGKNYVERAVIKAIKNDVAIYAVHTALDNHMDGVNKIFADAIGLTNAKILLPKENFIRKLVTYTVPENADKVRNAMFEKGAGTIGNYDHCSFNSEGFSTYIPNEGSDPVIGEQGKMTIGDEVKIEVTFKKHQEAGILKALFENHIYEEVAYEIYSLENKHQHIGLGMVGELETALSERDFLQMVKDKMQCGVIRHSEFINRNIKKVAVLGGSGSFAIKAAISAGADAYLTADLKYHDFYQAENKMLLADIGHFESERYTKNYIVDFLRKKITNFAIILSEINTNPVKYL
ncbi:MAG: Nif3-like dinuclear metal center hexameric protein [Flavobacterium sp.]|nr:MAG: Nif3-like dinuclear metal center hexameric protein [Flavobacterium sp.]